MKFDKNRNVMENLVPNTVNPTPDYYCTWQTQLYASSDGKPTGQRALIRESSLFGIEKPFGWAYFHELARRDLFLIMDDSWDVPVGEEDRGYYGSLILDKEKFPESTSGDVTNAQALKRLTARIVDLGWKGLGGWVCAQEAEYCMNGESVEEYWTHRVKECDSSGFGYWKVDWGKKAGDMEFRTMLSRLARKYAPNLVVEHAMIKDIIPVSDTYRTYDVPAVMSIPMTMEKLREFSDVPAPEQGYLGLINCEDEAYIAAAGGFSMGIMRHPYVGVLPDGRADMSFPSVHRNLKTKMYEVVRAARWHRIAPAFGMNSDEICVDSVELCDTWKFEKRGEEIEAWWLSVMPSVRDRMCGDVLTKTAPARIARRTDLPEIIPDSDGYVPYIVASMNPNGVYSVAACGRTRGRKYFIPRCRVNAYIGSAAMIGVFGEYDSITFETDGTLCGKRILAQDIADDKSYDITELVGINGKYLTVSGEIISRIGTLAQPEKDTSEPGMMIKII